MNKRITKAITLLLTLLMLFSLVGCNNAASDSDGGNDNSARDQQSDHCLFQRADQHECLG